LDAGDDSKDAAAAHWNLTVTGICCVSSHLFEVHFSSASPFNLVIGLRSRCWKKKMTAVSCQFLIAVLELEEVVVRVRAAKQKIRTFFGQRYANDQGDKQLMMMASYLHGQR
jgi:hypothetical protein